MRRKGTRVVATDHEARTDVAIRFENAVRAVLQRGDVASRWAVANLIGEMGVSSRSINARSLFVKDHLATLVPDLISLAETRDDPRLQEAAARALAKVHPDAKDVEKLAAALAPLLKSDRLATRQATAGALSGIIQTVAQSERTLRPPKRCS